MSSFQAQVHTTTMLGLYDEPLNIYLVGGLNPSEKD